jgi:ABC-2 type transport system permease protein
MAKDVRHILRDRQTLTILILMPLVQVVLFGYALRNDITDVRVAVVDPTPADVTLDLRHRLEGTGRFSIVATATGSAGIEQLFRRGEADLALVFEPGFARNLRRAVPARLLLVADAADPNSATTMQAYARSVIADWERDLSGVRPAVAIVPQVRMRFNPTLESVNLFVPGLIAFVLTLVAALMTAISLSREKERGTLEVLLVSPLRPWQIILGKVVPYLLLGFANALTALAAAWIIFQVPFRGSVFLLLAESLLYTMVSLALGVLIAARTQSQRVAMVAALAGTMMPNVLLSGMIFPIESMPSWLQPVTIIVPARWFIAIARGIMLKGVGLEYLRQPTLVLAGMTVALMAMATRSFKPRMG